MTHSLPTHDSYLSRKYFSSLDILRFFSIAAVLWHHTQEAWAWLPASGHGFLGVDFFFVISGYLIVTLLLRERDRTGGISLRGFYLRRSLRIFPVYYALIACLTVAFFLKSGSAQAGYFFRELPYHLTYLSNFVLTSSVLFFTWSLASEEQFYLVWPPIERWFPWAVFPALIVILAINQGINFGFFDAWIGGYIRHLNILQITFTPICLGVLVAYLLHSKRGFEKVVPILGRAWTPLALMVAIVLACNVSGDLRGWPRLIIQLVMMVFLVSCVVREDHLFNRAFGFNVIRRIGVISYGIYLFHMFVDPFVNAMLKKTVVPEMFVRFFLTLALTALLAELSFRFFETPFLRLKDRLGQGGNWRAAGIRAEIREDRPLQALIPPTAAFDSTRGPGAAA
ncbi:MAG TPA: acyltransferase [Tepidisphaeraceae bacterium]|jgi:peptidoglycan/LPS O-acetylase OafA/YrhL